MWFIERHTCNPSSLEVEAGGLRIWGLPGSQKEKKKIKEIITSETVINRDYEYIQGLRDSPGRTEHAGGGEQKQMCEDYQKDYQSQWNSSTVTDQEDLEGEASGRSTLSAEIWSKKS